jgi:hypothetical protein
MAATRRAAGRFMGATSDSSNLTASLGVSGVPALTTLDSAKQKEAAVSAETEKSKVRHDQRPKSRVRAIDRAMAGAAQYTTDWIRRQVETWIRRGVRAILLGEKPCFANVLSKRPTQNQVVPDSHNTGAFAITDRIVSSLRALFFSLMHHRKLADPDAPTGSICDTVLAGSDQGNAIPWASFFTTRNR